MGSITPWSLCLHQSVAAGRRLPVPALGGVRLVSRAAAGRWPGSGLDPPGGSLGDPTQSQHIKANVANSHRLVQIKLYNGNLLGRAFIAKQTPAVTTVMFASCDSELGSALVAVGAVTPRRLFGQHIQQSKQKLLGGDLVVENVDSLVIIHAKAGPGPDDGTAQVGVAFHVRQEQHCVSFCIWFI